MPDHWLLRDAKLLLRDFGEAVVVIDAPGAAPRTIRAIVDRLPSAPGRDGRRIEARIVIEVLNDPVLGIPSTADTGKVRVLASQRLGRSADAAGLTISMAEEAGGWADEGLVAWQLR